MDLTARAPEERPSKAATNSTEARNLLSASGSTALSLLLATEAIFGDAFIWEPETLWLSFERSGIEVPLVNRAKIQAGVTLMCVPSFYWDAVVFEKTALAFNDVLPNPEALQEATPAQLAWGVEEARRIAEKLVLPNHEWETEPKVYAAVVLHRAGYVLTPPQLSFAQAQLDRLNVNEGDLRSRVTERLGQLETLDVRDHEFEETAEGVQLAYLSAVKLYVTGKSKQLDAELRLLGT